MYELFSFQWWIMIIFLLSQVIYGNFLKSFYWWKKAVRVAKMRKNKTVCKLKKTMLRSILENNIMFIYNQKTFKRVLKTPYRLQFTFQRITSHQALTTYSKKENTHGGSSTLIIYRDYWEKNLEKSFKTKKIILKKVIWHIMVLSILVCNR